MRTDGLFALLLQLCVAVCAPNIPANETSPLTTEIGALIELYAATTHAGPWRQRSSWPIDVKTMQAHTDDFCAWRGITCTTDRHVADISIESVSRGGTLPESLGALAWLQSLDIGSNRLSGTLPQSIAALHALESIEADGNSFEGTVPASYEALLAHHRGAPRAGASVGGARVFFGMNRAHERRADGKLIALGFGFACPYPAFLMVETSQRVVTEERGTRVPGGSSGATAWGLPRQCGYTREDATPDEEKPAGSPGSLVEEEDAEEDDDDDDDDDDENVHSSVDRRERREEL